MAKITRIITEDVPVTYVQITLPANELDDIENRLGGTSPFPEAFRDKSSDTFTFRVTVGNGEIVGWPAGVVCDIYIKPRCAGTYAVLNHAGETIAERNWYVPKFLDMHDGGDDYLALKINERGVIDGFTSAWSDQEASEFFNAKDE